MSLFKLKSLATKVFVEEQFDEKHIAVGVIGDKPAIGLGNFQGLLRVFLVNRSKEVEMQSIYQNNFQSGIVSLEFVSHPDESIRGSALGVLFFRKFAFVSFIAGSSGGYQAKTLFIETQPAFGICVSPLSVMTLNSTIQNLNPRQINKIKVADPIYPFANQLNKLYFMDGEELVQMEGGTEQWRIIVGRVRQLFVMGDTVIAIGQQGLWEIEHAKIVKTKILEEEVSCGAIAFCSVNSYNILVANFSGQLFVYSSNYELLWAIKLDYIPVRLFVCQHHQIKGMMVLLSDQGSLELAYSGVEVPESIVEPVSEKIDYEVVQSETRQYLKKMNSKQEDKEAKKSEERVVAQGSYRLYFGQLEKSIQNNEQKSRLYQSDNRLVLCQLICQITSYETLRNFKLQLNLPQNIYCKEHSKQARTVKKGQRIIFHLYASNEIFPYERELTLMVRYQNNESRGAPFVKRQNVAFPMSLQCEISGYETKDTFPNKIIIKSNGELPSFNQLFPELFGRGSEQQRKSIKFTLANGVDCVIAYNKSFNKAKVQSEYYSGLCFIVSEFSHRIRQLNSKGQTKLELSVQIPLQEFFGIMKQHFEHRALLKKSYKELEVKAEEFRNTEKKLLVKMKEKMSSLGSIDKLLEYTYDKLMQSATNYEQTTLKMEIINHNLCVAVNFIIELLFIRANPSQKAKNIAVGILGYQKESMEAGWENKVLMTSSHFLNKKYNKGDEISFQQLQKIPLYVISKINNGDWN